jgi:hypothetical protein
MTAPPTAIENRLRSLRRLSLSAGILLLVESLAIGIILLASGHHLLLPVTADFPRGVLGGAARGAGVGTGALPAGSAAGTGMFAGSAAASAAGAVAGSGSGGRVILTAVDAGAAIVALCVLVCLARLAVASGRVFPRYSAALSRNRRTVRWIEFSFSSSITVFLVAQLNGITDVGTLVLIYAVTSGMTLFSVIQDRTTITRGHPLLALCFGAAIGIVPWGVIAFHEVGAGIVGAGPSVAVRIITLLMLAAAFECAISQWREQRRQLPRERQRPTTASAPAGAAVTGNAPSCGNAPSNGGAPSTVSTSTSSAPIAVNPIAGERVHILISVVATSVFAWTVVLGVVLSV